MKRKTLRSEASLKKTAMLLATQPALRPILSGLFYRTFSIVILKKKIIDLFYSFRWGFLLGEARGEGKRLFNCIVDNGQINQLIVHLEVGHETDTAAKAQFCKPVKAASSWQNFLASQAEKFGRSEKLNKT